MTWTLWYQNITSTTWVFVRFSLDEPVLNFAPVPWSICLSTYYITSLILSVGLLIDLVFHKVTGFEHYIF